MPRDFAHPIAMRVAGGRDDRRAFRSGRRAEADARRHRPASLAAAFLVSAVITSLAGPHPALAQQPDTGAAADAAEVRLDAVLATPNYVTPVPQDNLIATTPGLEQQTPRPQVV